MRVLCGPPLTVGRVDARGSPRAGGRGASVQERLEKPAGRRAARAVYNSARLVHGITHCVKRKRSNELMKYALYKCLNSLNLANCLICRAMQTLHPCTLRTIRAGPFVTRTEW